MILVGQYDSPYVRRVAIALKVLGIEFERNRMSVFADAEEMRRINPLGRIPSLILDDGEVLIDSAAILDHIDEVVGAEWALLPAAGAARRQALRITALATGAIDKAGAYCYERMLRPADKMYEPWLERCRTQLETGLAALEAATGDGYYVGDRLGLADITVGCLIAYLRMRQGEVLPAEVFSARTHPRLVGRAQALEALPGFRDTQPAPDETMPERP
jgi:glutathione S-transferase